MVRSFLILMAEQGDNYFEGQKISRIEGLSDGVFAIAMTLLVLDIKVPSNEVINSETELLMALYGLSIKFLSYLLGFITLGVFWLGSSVQFKFINKTDRHFTWLSIFFLMFVSLLPFTTALLSEHIHFKFSIGIYWLNIFLAGTTLLIHWNYAYRKNLIDDSIDKAAVNEVIRGRIIYAQLLYPIAALFCLVNNYLSVFLIVLVQLNYAFALLFNSKTAKVNLETKKGSHR